MPTKQFKWIDRDTAAHDMLQLVYHAPPQIAEQVVKLLKAIRSPAIIPELKAIVLDAEYDVQRRRDIYAVICATQGNYDLSAFELVIGKVFNLNDFPRLFDLLKNHPINKDWITRYLEVEPRTSALYWYSKLIEYMPEIVGERILKILMEKETGFGKDLGFKLYKFGGGNFQIWLDKNLENFIRSWLVNDLGDKIEKYSLRLHEFTRRENWLNQWPELKSALGMLTPEKVSRYIEDESINRQKLICILLLPYAPSTASELLLKWVEEKLIFLDLQTAGLLHEYGDENTQRWLVEHWDELIYLCLIDSIDLYDQSEKIRIVHILEKWPELKEAVFHNCPAFIEEYEQIRTRIEDDEVPSQQVSDSDIQASSVWQEIEKRRDEWVEQTEIGSKPDLFSHYLGLNHLRSETDIPLAAAETYFLGTILPYNYHNFGNYLRRLVRSSPDQWHKVVTMVDDPDMTFVYSPIRFEAAYAIRNVMEPSNWECMVETFLMCKYELAETPASLGDNLFRWISRMTDMLSGVEPELPDEETPLSARPWFCALVQQESNTPKV